jgi:hypothetical protein
VIAPLARGRFGVSAWIYGDAPLPETLGRIAAGKDTRSADILDSDLRESLRRLRACWPPRSR